jgi:hypothetical protein
MHPENIIIGKPLVDLKTLGVEDSEYTVFTEERYLPKLLVQYGFMTSIGEVKRNRPDLVRDLNKTDMEFIKIGKKRFWLIVGE